VEARKQSLTYSFRRRNKKASWTTLADGRLWIVLRRSDSSPASTGTVAFACLYDVSLHSGEASWLFAGRSPRSQEVSRSASSASPVISLIRICSNRRDAKSHSSSSIKSGSREGPTYSRKKPEPQSPPNPSFWLHRFNTLRALALTPALSL